jgi:hypothetical protein
MWKKYYQVCRIDHRFMVHSLSRSWAIFNLDEGCENPGSIAYDKNYRTQAAAERGAERLYRRNFGYIENLFVGDDNEQRNQS